MYDSLNQGVMMKSLNKVVMHVCITLLSFCFVDNHAWAEAKKITYQGYSLYSDVEYGEDPSQSFDVYTHDDFSNAPVIFMVHGGAWSSGDKTSASVVHNKVLRWLPQGFVFISVNYRLVPSVSPLEQAQDLKKAIVVAQDKAHYWGADSSKFILMGHSAGAHLVALVSSAVSNIQTIGGVPWLGTVILDSAALNLPEIMQREHYRFYDKAFGSEESFWYQTSPFHQLQSDARPLLAACSSRRVDACMQAESYIARAIEEGIRAYVLSRNYSHKSMNSKLGENNSYTKDVELFMSSLDKGVKDLLSDMANKNNEKVRQLLQIIIERKLG
ncbi:alpha/beta hydrolase [Neptuniibacter sp. PT8_73]|uniref:alpha/beta hydrolase n=1 Tax=Neptuniibacter sp. PT8_73 TaxID=3398206 RepID=UPI0039F5700A